MSKTNPVRAPNCPKISILAPEKVILWPKIYIFGTKCKIIPHVVIKTLYMEF